MTLNISYNDIKYGPTTVTITTANTIFTGENSNIDARLSGYGLLLTYSGDLQLIDGVKAKGKFAIEVANERDLLSALELVKSATLAGELDSAIDNASNKLRAGFAK
jgi:hypothetical protein